MVEFWIPLKKKMMCLASGGGVREIGAEGTSQMAMNEVIGMPVLLRNQSYVIHSVLKAGTTGAPAAGVALAGVAIDFV
jgi:hypothetical protein